ncbi:MAG: histidine kinase [Bacteroidales bacterium]|nr:histidine kinase [Bacteroidales bacterium]
MLKQFTITMPVDMIAAYLTVYLLITKFLYKQRYLMFVLLFLISAFGVILLQRLVLIYITYPVFYPDSTSELSLFKLNYVYSFFNIYAIVGIFASIKLLKLWFKNQQVNRKLEKEKLEAELKFLKAQIHPHFLFNTLNNLYALTIDKSDLAPEVVIKLSDLLDYMLYECNASKIALEKEIKLLQDYLELEKIRYGNDLKIDFQISGSVKGKMIAPLLLLPFLENSFKHGLSSIIDNVWIRINLKISKNVLNLKIENSKSSKTNKKDGGFAEGIGLKNVRRRLDLIYPEKYELDINDEGNVFVIDLTIEIENKQTLNKNAKS